MTATRPLSSAWHSAIPVCINWEEDSVKQGACPLSKENWPSTWTGCGNLRINHLIIVVELPFKFTAYWFLTSSLFPGYTWSVNILIISWSCITKELLGMIHRVINSLPTIGNPGPFTLISGNTRVKIMIAMIAQVVAGMTRFSVMGRLCRTCTGGGSCPPAPGGGWVWSAGPGHRSGLILDMAAAEIVDHPLLTYWVLPCKYMFY